MSQKLFIEIFADASKVSRAVSKSKRELTGLAGSVDKIDSRFSKLQKITAGGFLGGTAAVAAAAGIKQIVDAAANSQQVLGQTKVALDDTGLSWEKYGQRIQNVVAAQSKLGFDDEELMKTFSGFVRLTGDVNKALDLNALTVNVARGRYIDLASAASIVSKAQLGNAGALRRINIDAPKAASNLQLLALLEKKYGDAATKAANDQITANARLHTSLQNIEEQLGSGLLPAVAAFADELSTATDNASALVAELQKIKIPGLPSGGGFDLGKLIKAGIIATPGLNLVAGSSLLLKKLLPDKAKVVQAGGELGETFGLTFLSAARKVGERNQAAGGGIPVSLRNQWFDTGIEREIFRSQGASLAAQIAALQDVEAKLTARIGATSDPTRRENLRDQLISAQRQVSALRQQQRQNAADARQQAIQDAKDARDRARQAAEDRLAAISSRQFRQLGLAADGNAVTPSVANLRKRIGTFETNVRGTFLDTNKTRTQLARFRKVLAEGLVPKDVRAKVDEMLRDLSSTLRDGLKKTNGELTRTTKLDQSAILSGLGLDPKQIRELRARLSHFNSAGVARAGTGSTSQGVNVYASTTVVIDGRQIEPVVTRHQQTRSRRNPPSRRGPNAGLTFLG